MPTTTKNKTPDIGAMFEQAVKMYEEAAQAGLHAQEEAVKWYTDSLSELGGPAEWQQRSETMFTEAAPTVKKNFEEAIAVMNRNAEAGLAMLHKAYESATPGSLDQMQVQTRELWEHTLGVMRENAQATLQMNAKMLDTWARFARGQTPPGTKVD